MHFQYTGLAVRLTGVVFSRAVNHVIFDVWGYQTILCVTIWHTSLVSVGGKPEVSQLAKSLG